MSVKAGQSIEELYLAEKKRSQIFATMALLLGVALAGSIYAYVKKPTVSNTASTGVPQFEQRMPGGTAESGRLRMGLQDLGQFFSKDGDIDAVKLDELTSRLPAGFSQQFLERFEQTIDQAVSDGTLTSDQAKKLKSALEERTANVQ